MKYTIINMTKMFIGGLLFGCGSYAGYYIAAPKIHNKILKRRLKKGNK